MSTSTPVANAWVDDRTMKLRSKTIPWDGYERAGLLSSDDVNLVQKITSGKANSESLLEQEGATYADLYIRLLSKLSRNDTIQCVLVLIGDMIAERDERIYLLCQGGAYQPLLKQLDSQDDFIRLKASIILAAMISVDGSVSEEAMSRYLSSISALIGNASDPEGQDVGVQCLEGVLQVDKARKMAWQLELPSDSKDAGTSTSGGSKPIGGLVQLLKAQPNSQMQYQLGFCFWLLTFDDTMAEELNMRFDVIPLLADLAKVAIKEKVVRVVMATFRNLVVKAPEANLPAMLVAHVLPLVQSLKSRKWSDDEIVDDIQFLHEELKKSFDGMTTYDEYTSELVSGHLTWSPAHKDEDFWRENAGKLNEKEREPLKRLLTFLSSSDESYVTIALSDVSHYIKYAVNAKHYVEQLGAKAKIMELMAHSNADVKYQALVCVQRLMTTRDA